MSAPRHLVVDLVDAASASTVPWSSPDPDLAPAGRWGGVAAGLAQLARGEPGLQLAVGPAVVRGVGNGLQQLASASPRVLPG